MLPHLHYLRFEVERNVPYGFCVAVVGSHTALGEWHARSAPRLECNNQVSPHVWSATISLATTATSKFYEYKYIVLNGDQQIVEWEAGRNRRLELPSVATRAITLRDRWKIAVPPQHAVLRSAAFGDAIFRHAAQDFGPVATAQWMADDCDITMEWRIEVLRLPATQRVVVLGSLAQMRDPTTTSNAIIMKPAARQTWRLRISTTLAEASRPIDYRYGIVDESGVVVTWESVTRRMVCVKVEAKSAIFTDDDTFQYISEQTAWKGAGVSIPLYALNTRTSVGCGEFRDLERLGEWAKQAGLSFIQVLPINDTSRSAPDGNPYRVRSAFALNPIYVSLELADPSGACEREIRTLREDCTSGPFQYDIVLRRKLDILRQLFNRIDTKLLFQEAAFCQFFAANKSWLQPYAVFCHLAELYKSDEFNAWPEHSTMTLSEVESMCVHTSPSFPSISFTFYVQYLLFSQLSSAAQNLTQRQLSLMATIPVGLVPSSVDVWMHPKLFKTGWVIGERPTRGSPNGQTWNLACYDWDAMVETGYAWWRERLKVLSRFFTSYRLDHVAGLFRTWEVPQDSITGKVGRARPALPIWHWELEESGIWDFDRLCDPYIRMQELNTLFGDETGSIVKQYLVEFHPWCFRFKPEFSSEKALVQTIEAQYSSCDSTCEMVKSKLLELKHNVVLLRDAQDRYRFDPRWDMHLSSSFLALPDSDKAILFHLADEFVNNRQRKLWAETGTNRLCALLKSSNMLMIGDDTGYVPSMVASTLADLAIPCVRVQRIPKESASDPYDLTRSYPTLSLCMPSTHDQTCITMWWQTEARSAIKSFWSDELGRHGEPPAQLSIDALEQIFRNHLNSNSMFALFGMQDILSLCADLPTDMSRINDPSHPEAPTNWRYRMQPCIEDLLIGERYSSLTRQLAVLTSASGRS